MTRLVSMALYDPDGIVAPFVRRTFDQLARPDTTIVATSTRPLRPADAAWVRERAELVERENVGLDLFSHHLVLTSRDLSQYDEVITTNDTYVLLQPLDAVEQDIDPKADFWGFTISPEVRPHVQSFYVDFRSSAIRNPAFLEHWRAVRPLRRRAMIRTNEVGMSRSLLRAGLRMDAAFRPTARDRRLARARALRHGWFNPRSVLGHWNPNSILAEAALEGRMPMAKISTLRYDPFKIGAADLLDRLEETFPAPMRGVREYLERTGTSYRKRSPIAEMLREN